MITLGKSKMSKLSPLLPIAYLGTTLASLTLAIAPAPAGEICNYQNLPLYLAVATQNTNNIWISEGWWVIEPGECVTYPDQALTYLKVTENESPVRKIASNVKNTSACVVNDKFVAFSAISESACDEVDGDLVPFLQAGNNLELITP